MKNKSNINKATIILNCIFLSGCSFQEPVIQKSDIKNQIPYEINKLIKEKRIAKDDNVSIINTGKQGASFLTKISFEDGIFSTKASSNGVDGKKSSDITKVDVYLVELSAPPVSGSDPLAVTNIIGSSVNLPKSGSTFNVLFSGVPTNSSGKKYYVGVIAKDNSNNVISRTPAVAWTGNTAIIAPALAITATGVGVDSLLHVDSITDLTLSVPLINAIGANINSNLSVTNGSTVIANPITSSLSKLGAVLSVKAGNTSGVSPSNNQIATNVLLNSPKSVAVDLLGVIYVADSGNNYIEKIDYSGNMNIIAGNSSGVVPTINNQIATNVKLNNPSGISIDSSGNIYIADTTNGYIEKIDTNGNLKIIAGNPSGTTPAAINQPATNVKLNMPNGITTDSSGNIFIADSANNYIEKIDTNGNLKIIAGYSFGTPPLTNNQTATSVKLNNPVSVAVDSSGNIFIADSANYIEKIDTNGLLKIIAGNSSGVVPTINNQVAINVKLNNPSGISVDLSGNIYIADTINGYIEQIDSSGNLKIIAGNSSGVTPAINNQPATNIKLNMPTGIMTDSSGNIFITDTANNFIEKIANLN